MEKLSFLAQWCITLDTCIFRLNQPQCPRPWVTALHCQAQPLTIREPFTTSHWRTIYTCKSSLENHLPLTSGEPSTRASLHRCWCNDDSQDVGEGLDGLQVFPRSFAAIEYAGMVVHPLCKIQTSATSSADFPVLAERDLASASYAKPYLVYHLNHLWLLNQWHGAGRGCIAGKELNLRCAQYKL